MKDLLQSYVFVGACMSIIILLLTFVIKIPIKAITKKISNGNEKLRKILNIIILVIPFALGILGQYIFSELVNYARFDLVIGLGYGTASISLYSAIERFFGVKLKNPYDTKEGELVVNTIDKIKEDGKVDKNDKTAVEEFLEQLKK